MQLGLFLWQKALVKKKKPVYNSRSDGSACGSQERRKDRKGRVWLKTSVNKRLLIFVRETAWFEPLQKGVRIWKKY